jgi:hypothetical protein
VTKPGPKKTTPRTPTPIEDFGPAHWHLLFLLEEINVSVVSDAARAGRQQIANVGPESPVLLDLADQDFVTIGKSATLTERGWEVSAAIRRWKAEGKNPDEFVAITCSSCGRTRFGERRPCLCGGAK